MALLLLLIEVYETVKACWSNLSKFSKHLYYSVCGRMVLQLQSCLNGLEGYYCLQLLYQEDLQDLVPFFHLEALTCQRALKKTDRHKMSQI